MSNSVKLKIGKTEFIAKVGTGFIERTIKTERPDGNNVMLVPKGARIFNAIAYELERKGKAVPESLRWEIYDWLDEVGYNDESVQNFEIKFYESMRVHIEDKEAVKVFDDAIEKLTKKKALKSGKSTGKKTS